MMMTWLEDKRFYMDVRPEYESDVRGYKGERITKGLFISDAQVEMERQFCSGFMYGTDATFNNNKLNMSLSSMVRITNTGTIFPLTYCFISSESARTFEFIMAMRTMYVFYDCSEPRVILADFAKGLAAALRTQVEREKAGNDP